MELTREEAVVLSLLRELGRRRRTLVRGRDMIALEKLVFLAAHGVFDEKGNIVGVRVFPRFDVDYIVYFRGVHSRDIHEILERLELKGLITIEHDIIKVTGKDDNTYIDDPEIRKAVEYAARYADRDAKELEELTNRLLGIKSEAAKALVFASSVIKLLKAREEARRLREQGLLVDV